MYVFCCFVDHCIYTHVYLFACLCVCMCDHAHACMFTVCACLDMCTFTHVCMACRGCFRMSAQRVFNGWLVCVLCSLCCVLVACVFTQYVPHSAVMCISITSAFSSGLWAHVVSSTYCIVGVLWCIYGISASCGVQFSHCALCTEWHGTNTALQHSGAAQRCSTAVQHSGAAQRCSTARVVKESYVSRPVSL